MGAVDLPIVTHRVKKPNIGSPSESVLRSQIVFRSDGRWSSNFGIRHPANSPVDRGDRHASTLLDTRRPTGARHGWPFLVPSAGLGRRIASDFASPALIAMAVFLVVYSILEPCI